MIPEVKRILYASDLGEDTRPAFRAAVRLCLCGNFQTRITFLNVVEPIASNAKSVLANLMSKEDLEKLTTEGVESLKKQVSERVQRFMAEEVEEHDRLIEEQVEMRIEEGEAWEEILKAADDIDATVIVIGTRHNDSFGHLLFGSTATKVMQKSQRPVLVVPL